MTASDFSKEDMVTLLVNVGGTKKEVQTKVEEVKADILYLEPFYVNGKTVGFGKDCFVSLVGNFDNQLFLWKLLGLPLVKRHGRLCYQARLVGAGEHFNRRGAFRVFIGENMLVNIFKDGKPQQFEVLVKDLSATGICFIDKNDFEVSKNMRVTIPLNENDSISVGGSIIRKVEDQNKGVFQYGCKFIDHSNKLNEYLMNLQREKQAQKNMASGKNVPKGKKDEEAEITPTLKEF